MNRDQVVGTFAAFAIIGLIVSEQPAWALISLVAYSAYCLITGTEE